MCCKIIEKHKIINNIEAHGRILNYKIDHICIIILNINICINDLTLHLI